MKVFVLSSNSSTEDGIKNETRVFDSIEKAKNVFQKILAEIRRIFPEEEWSDNICASNGDFVTNCWVQDSWHWWSLTIEEKEVE